MLFKTTWYSIEKLILRKIGWIAENINICVIKEFHISFCERKKHSIVVHSTVLLGR